MLVIGPNRVFLRYIERVLPSLGEAGVEQVVLADLVPDVDLRRAPRRRVAARVKGDARMADVIGQGGARPRAAAAGGPRRARSASTYLRLTVEDTRSHRAGRPPPLPPPQRRPPVRRERGVRGAGRVTGRHRDDRRGRARPHPPPRAGAGGAGADVAGADAGPAAARPVRLHARCCASPPSKWLSDDEWTALYRPRHAHGAPTAAVRSGRTPTSRLLDEARELLGPRPGQPHAATPTATRSAPTATSSSTRCRTSRRCSCGWWPAARSTAR